MANSRSLMAIILIRILFALAVDYIPCLEARKLIMEPSLKDSSLVQGLLPTAPALPSSPGETLISVHLAMIDPILQSVPSPGAGHLAIYTLHVPPYVNA